MAKTDLKVNLDDNRKRNVAYCKAFLEASREGEVEVLTSNIAVAECLHVGDENMDDDARRLFKGLLTSGKGGVVLIQNDHFVTLKARDLYSDDKIKIGRAADRIHLASAIERECEEFVTCDEDDFIKRAEQIYQIYGIRVISPTDTKLLPKKYLQGKLI